MTIRQELIDAFNQGIPVYILNKQYQPKKVHKYYCLWTLSQINIELGRLIENEKTDKLNLQRCKELWAEVIQW